MKYFNAFRNIISTFHSLHSCNIVPLQLQMLKYVQKHNVKEDSLDFEYMFLKYMHTNMRDNKL